MHEATTATRSIAVCSIGSITRSCGMSGTARKSRSPNARRRQAHFLGGAAGVAAGAVILGGMPLQVRDQGEIARALDCRRQLALMTGARAAQAARKNFSLIGDESAERPVGLVGDPADTSLAEGG